MPQEVKFPSKVKQGLPLNEDIGLLWACLPNLQQERHAEIEGGRQSCNACDFIFPHGSSHFSAILLVFG